MRSDGGRLRGCPVPVRSGANRSVDGGCRLILRRLRDRLQLHMPSSDFGRRLLCHQEGSLGRVRFGQQALGFLLRPPPFLRLLRCMLLGLSLRTLFRSLLRRTSFLCRLGFGGRVCRSLGLRLLTRRDLFLAPLLHRRSPRPIPLLMHTLTRRSRSLACSGHPLSLSGLLLRLPLSKRRLLLSTPGRSSRLLLPPRLLLRLPRSLRLLSRLARRRLLRRLRLGRLPLGLARRLGRLLLGQPLRLRRLLRGLGGSSGGGRLLRRAPLLICPCCCSLRSHRRSPSLPRSLRSGSGSLGFCSLRVSQCRKRCLSCGSGHRLRLSLGLLLP